MANFDLSAVVALRMHRPEPEPEAAEDEAEQEADVETLYFGDIIAMEAREYVQRPHDSYAERVRKREFSKYMVNIKSYWTVSASLSWLKQLKSFDSVHALQFNTLVLNVSSFSVNAFLC